jgi:cytochrome c oxidase cbb3-type subunit III
MIWPGVILAQLAVTAWGQTPAPAVPKGGGIGLISRAIPDAAAVDRGKTIYSSACSFCHGSNAKGGDGGPDLIRSVPVLRDEGGNLIGPIVLKGNGAMPKFDFSQEQVSDLAAFLRYTTQLTIDRRTYELANVPTGDAKAGEAFFKGAGQCMRCHATAQAPGPTEASSLAGIGTRYDIATLQSQVAYPNLRSAPGYERSRIRATVTQADGTVLTGIVEALDDFTIRIRDAAGARQTLNRGPNIQVVDPLAYHEELLNRMTDAELHNVASYLWGMK